METHRTAPLTHTHTHRQCAAHKCSSPFKLRIHLHATISSCATIIVIYLSLRVCVSGKQLNVTQNAMDVAFRRGSATLAPAFCHCVCVQHNHLAFERNGDHTPCKREKETQMMGFRLFCILFRRVQIAVASHRKGEREHLFQNR